MTENAQPNGMTLAPGVVDTIISIAVNEVEGVKSHATTQGSKLRQVFGSKPSNKDGLTIEPESDGTLHITLHIDVEYGNVIPEIAAKIRSAVADALRVQAGVEVSSIDIYVDGINFEQA